MYSKEEKIVKDDSEMSNDDFFVSIEEQVSSDELSLAEEVFATLQIS